MPPKLSVIVCGVPRSGTALLTSLLESAGVGHPAEYFWRDDIAAFKRSWKVSSPRDYVDAVVEAGQSANGVFASKLMWGHLDELFLYLRAYTADYASGDAQVLGRVFPNPAFVWLRRDDQVAQAVSWWKAIQTGQWWAGQEATAGAVYGFEQIDWLVNQIRVYDGCWRRWFQSQGIEPITVGYREVREDPEGVTGAVLDMVGLHPDPGIVIRPMEGLVRQADEVNAEWIARYLEDPRSRGRA